MGIESGDLGPRWAEPWGYVGKRVSFGREHQEALQWRRHLTPGSSSVEEEAPDREGLAESLSHEIPKATRADGYCLLFPLLKNPQCD